MPTFNAKEAYDSLVDSLTHWSLLDAAKDTNQARQKAAADYFARRYWGPVYYIIWLRVRSEHRAEDLTQDFFFKCLTKDFLARASKDKGRFRGFLFTSVRHFLNSQPPQPKHEDISPVATGEGGKPNRELADNDTPEAIFNRVWTMDILLRVVTALEIEFKTTGKEVHLDIFRQCVVDPILKKAKRPSLKSLAPRYKLTPKEVESRLTTAQRAYKKLLRAEIATFAKSEKEIDDEIRDMLKFLSDK